MRHAHVDDQRTREPRQGRPVEPPAGRTASGSLWPVTNATAEAAARCVTGIPAYAVTPTPAVTPGHDLEGDARVAERDASSAPRPKTSGSPPLSRTTDRPARACSIRTSWMSSWRHRAVPDRLARAECAGPSAGPGRAARAGQMVVHDDVGAREQRLAAPGQEPGIARPGADQVDLSHADRPGAGFLHASRCSSSTLLDVRSAAHRISPATASDLC